MVMDHVKGGLKVLTSYLISLLIFGVFLYVFLSIAKDQYSRWLPLYSFLFFLLLLAILYSDMKRLAIKEKKPQYELQPYPLKGLVMGLIGFLPVILIELVLLPIDFGAAQRIKEVALKAFLGPVFWILRLAGGSVIAYILTFISVPLITMLAYLAGYFGIDLGKLGKQKIAPPEKPFAKSPWNPTAAAAPTKKSKKKK